MKTKEETLFAGGLTTSGSSSSGFNNCIASDEGEICYIDEICIPRSRIGEQKEGNGLCG